MGDLQGRVADLAIRIPRRSVVLALQQLRSLGLVLGLASNCDEREMRAGPDSVLAPLFGAAVFSCEVGAAKPSARADRALVPRWGGIPLSEAVFVGDGSNDELAGARRAGFSRVVFDDEFVSVNGLRAPEEGRRLRGGANLTVPRLGDLVSAWTG